MRYAYAITGALLLGGATATIALQPGHAQSAQNEPGAIEAVIPKSGAPLSFADMVAKLQPAVVNISTKQTIVQKQQANPFAGTPFGDLFGGGAAQGGAPVKREGQSLGSGFLISPDGYVVTNNHVISPGAQGATVDSIAVTLSNHKEYIAKVIGKDQDSDLALLKIDATNLPYVKFGDSSRARVGDWVVAIGEPFGLGGTVTAGIISSINRVTGQGGAYDRFIQTDASINQGNSGGPMFDMNGNVIGINSQIFSQSGGNIGIGFAIPAATAKPIIQTFMKGGTIERGYIGVQIQPGTIDDDTAAALGIPKNQGELIADTTAGGPAAKGGVRAGDVVTKVNGQAVTPEQTLSYLVSNVAPGSTARLDILRNGKPAIANVTVATRPSADKLAEIVGGDTQGFGGTDNGDDDTSSTAAPAAGGMLGMAVQPLTPGIARAIGVDASTQGVVIASVDNASDAYGKLKRGDVIISVNATPVKTAADVDRLVQSAKAAGRPQVLLQVKRGSGPARFLPFKLKG
ncbi:Do family serine endopeptidase [Sphingomonas oligophenolica]|uniref:Do family serine endopeptidase n=1 Tax=Sphingomonas oligophenolica TaxID=301154 RepID=A0A502CG86_9SPHN|nr:Do family serine endopeptidase [Sphingomonas oligophenolica]TPG11998.1 Do family serine endopeptidase [Sphingomonas oligophenolica]